MADSRLADLTALDPIAGEDLLYLVDDPAGIPVERKGTADSLRAMVGLPDILHVREEYTSGTAGPSGSTTTWNVRVLNTEEYNTITGASLATNQITLPAGTYRVHAHAGYHDGDRQKLALYNVTDAANEVLGTAAISNNSDLSMSHTTLFGQFTIAAEKDFELRHYTQIAKTNGLGVAVSSGEVEVYAEVIIERKPE